MIFRNEIKDHPRGFFNRTLLPESMFKLKKITFYFN